MTDLERLAYNILQASNVAVLRRTAPRKYEFLGFPPPFYESLFPGYGTEPCTDPWKRSSMLDYFLNEAEEMFESENDKRAMDSGMWVEEGLNDEETALRATAKWTSGVPVIEIRLIKEEYKEKVTTLRKAREQLLVNRQLSYNLNLYKEKSCVDGLTGLFNKATFLEVLADEIKRSLFLDYPISLLVLDLDDFKKVNDSYGHLMGDKVLEELGKSLKCELRRSDIIGRYGGEEFVILLPHTGQEEARQVAEKVRESVAVLVVPGVPHFTVSIGCTEYVQSETLEEFFERADKALYAAKNSGKNKVCVEAGSPPSTVL